MHFKSTLDGWIFLTHNLKPFTTCFTSWRDLSEAHRFVLNVADSWRAAVWISDRRKQKADFYRNVIEFFCRVTSVCRSDSICPTEEVTSSNINLNQRPCWAVGMDLPAGGKNGSLYSGPLIWEIMFLFSWSESSKISQFWICSGWLTSIAAADTQATFFLFLVVPVCSVLSRQGLWKQLKGPKCSASYGSVDESLWVWVGGQKKKKAHERQDWPKSVKRWLCFNETDAAVEQARKGQIGSQREDVSLSTMTVEQVQER